MSSSHTPTRDPLVSRFLRSNDAAADKGLLLLCVGFARNSYLSLLELSSGVRWPHAFTIQQISQLESHLSLRTTSSSQRDYCRVQRSR